MGLFFYPRGGSSRRRVTELYETHAPG